MKFGEFGVVLGGATNKQTSKNEKEGERDCNNSDNFSDALNTAIHGTNIPIGDCMVMLLTPMRLSFKDCQKWWKIEVVLGGTTPG